MIGGGKGGGGNGSDGNATTGVAAIANTGSGGGSGGGNWGDGASGGSGLVIIRYRRSPTTSSVIELIRGTTTDGTIDYSIGNYDGSFKILTD